MEKIYIYIVILINIIYINIKTMKKQQAKRYYVYTITYFDQIMYVGKTYNFKRRKEHHKYERGTHHSAIPVDADMSKVVFNVVAEFNNEEEALKCEDELILKYGTINNGWNRQRSGLVYSDREYVLAQKAAYYEANRGHIRAQQREYRAAHSDELRAYKRDYYEAHREDIAAYKRAYRARKKA